MQMLPTIWSLTLMVYAGTQIRWQMLNDCKDIQKKDVFHESNTTVFQFITVQPIFSLESN